MTDNGLAVREMLDGLEYDELQDKAEAPLQLVENWQPLRVPVL